MIFKPTGRKHEQRLNWINEKHKISFDIFLVMKASMLSIVQWVVRMVREVDLRVRENRSLSVSYLHSFHNIQHALFGGEIFLVMHEGSTMKKKRRKEDEEEMCRNYNDFIA